MLSARSWALSAVSKRRVVSALGAYVAWALVASGRQPTPASAAAIQRAAPPVVQKRTFIYKSVEGLQLQADVHRLPGEGARGVVVWLHPGGLIMGSRAMLPEDERDRLLRAGLVVVAVDYRLAPETKLPGILSDVEDALRWVREEGPRLFGVDARRVAVMGASAGGYLALLVAAHTQPRLAAIVSLYGYGDIAGSWYSRPDSFYRSLPRVNRAEAYRAIGQVPVAEGSLARNAFYIYCRQNGLWPREVAGLDPVADASQFVSYSPERLIGVGYSPTLLLHGDRDVDVPFQMSERLAAILGRAQVEHRLIRLEGLNHAFDVFATYPPSGAPIGLSRPEVSRAFDEVVAFLQKHLHS